MFEQKNKSQALEAYSNLTITIENSSTEINSNRSNSVPNQESDIEYLGVFFPLFL